MRRGSGSLTSGPSDGQVAACPAPGAALDEVVPRAGWTMTAASTTAHRLERLVHDNALQGRARGKQMADDDQSAADRLRMQRATLADFGLVAFRCNDLDDLLHRACELVSQALEVKLVKVLEHQAKQHCMLVRSGVNWQPGVVGEVRFGDDDKSPGGYALRTGEPVFSADVDAETRFRIPDVLLRHGVKSMANVLIAGEDRPFGVLEVDAPRHRNFNEDDIACLRTYANRLAAAIERIRSQKRLRKHADEQNILARELGHRVKNVLSLVQALASQTSAQGRSGEEFQKAFMGRLRALSQAETLIFEAAGKTVDPRRLAEAVLEPHRADRPEAVVIEGEPAQLDARDGRMLVLALHELATNAAKHGALSVPDGRISLSWRLEESESGTCLHLVWQECDGPEVKPPQRKGFGTRLLEDIVSRELNGSADLSLEPEGLVYRLVFPVAAT